MTSGTLLSKVELFLFDEADLLDTWKLKEWEALFTADGRYNIPPLNVENAETIESGQVLFLAHDDRRMIKGRVERLLKKGAHVESPRSNILHMLSNIRILSDDGKTLRAVSHFHVYRARRGQVTNYIGRYFHTLQHDGDSFKIQEKRVCLSNDLLQPQGSIGIIL
jgi:p-cumate 2,3-dioxygenase beta subunit